MGKVLGILLVAASALFAQTTTPPAGSNKPQPPPTPPSTSQPAPKPAPRKPPRATINPEETGGARGFGLHLRGTVVDANGQRVRGARVEAGGRTTTTDELGRFRLADVPAGEVTVEAGKEDARGGERLTLAPGDQQLSLQISLQPAD